jgi:hypothetical protein
MLISVTERQYSTIFVPIRALCWTSSADKVCQDGQSMGKRPSPRASSIDASQSLTRHDANLTGLRCSL